MPEPVLSIRGLSKSFGGARALADVDLDLMPGEVHGLLGQNGSGKSTLIKILGGYHSPDQGTISLSGQALRLPIIQPHHHGIAIIHQDLGLVGSMSVLENIGIPDGYGARNWRPVNWRKLRGEVEAILTRLEAEIDLDSPVETLSASDHTVVAVVRALRLLAVHAEQHIFVLDEPTAYLGPSESSRLLSVMRAVARSGATVAFVSHKLNEVLDVTDRCTVLRDGKVVTTVATKGMSAHDMVTLQLGRAMEDFYPPPAGPPQDRSVLRVEMVHSAGNAEASFKVRAGEIVGLTGLAGMGQDALIEGLAGARRRDGGVVHGPRAENVRQGVREALSAGIALVPADRKRQGLWLDALARENFTLPSFAFSKPWQRTSARGERAAALSAFRRVGVRPLSPDQPVGAFSGGNQQKVLMAKWLAFEPGVLLLHEPTQGVDAGARRDILELVNDAAAAGAGVVMCSTDYEQLAATCHRVLVMRHGRVVSEQVRPMSEADLLLACQDEHEDDGSPVDVVPGNHEGAEQWNSV
jgi:ribose transport system ATP-binding protein